MRPLTDRLRCPRDLRTLWHCYTGDTMTIYSQTLRTLVARFPDVVWWYNQNKCAPAMLEHPGAWLKSIKEIQAMKSIPLSGVYVITNTVNGHKYIGSAIDLESRRKLHFKSLAKGKHHSKYLQRAYDKYGADCFAFSVLTYCKRSQLVQLEQRAMDQYKPEYNIAPRAGSQLGFKHTEASRQKMSEKAKGRTFTEEFKEKMRILFTGKKRPENVVKKITAANKGRVITPEWRSNLSESHKGNKHTPEQTEKIRAAHLGRKNTPETIAKMKESARRRVARQRGEDVE